MADPHWTSYVGMITGIAGALIAAFSYWKSARLKALDFRLELRKSLSDFHLEYEQVLELMEYANKSRQAVASATGTYRSGAMELWNQQFEKSKSKLSQLLEEAPKADAFYSSYSSEKLETKLVDVHRLQSQLRGIKEKFQQALKADDEERKQIREDNRNLR